MRSAAIFCIVVVAAVSASAASVSSKHIVFQLRHDNGQVVRIVVLTAGPKEQSLRPRELLEKLGPHDLRPSVWLIAGAYRLDDKSRAFTDILGGWSFERYRSLTIKELRDGDVLVMHHPYP